MNILNHAKENVIIFAEVSAEVVLLMYFPQNLSLQSKREKIIISCIEKFREFCWKTDQTKTETFIKASNASLEYGLHFVGY